MVEQRATAWVRAATVDDDLGTNSSRGRGGCEAQRLWGAVVGKWQPWVQAWLGDLLWDSMINDSGD